MKFNIHEEFKPVTITFETHEELDHLHGLLSHVKITDMTPTFRKIFDYFHNNRLYTSDYHKTFQKIKSCLEHSK